MKNKLVYLILKNIQTIIKYLFWFYFIVIIGFHLYNDYVPKAMGFFFWFLLGIYLGFLLAIESIAYIKKGKE
jgi:hypothetical protein